MFRSVKSWLTRIVFVVAGASVSITAHAGTAGTDNVSRLAVLRASLERSGAFEEKAVEGKSGVQGKQAEAKAAKVSKLTVRRGRLAGLVTKVAAKHGVPAALANAVVTVESNYNPGVRGSAGEVGLMQIKPATARGMGFRGTVKTLYDPATNLEWGMRYLAEAHRRAGGDLCGTILRYNAGHYARRMNPVSRRYCQKVKQILS